MDQFTGLMAAVFTPFDQQGKINISVIPDFVERLISNRLSGVFICGSNGEGPNMTLDERMRVAEAFVKTAHRQIKVIIHVGHSSIADAKVLAAHAESIGADAVSAVACFYFKPASIQYLVDSMAEIAVAAPNLPFYYYHIPRLTGVEMDMLTFLQLAEKTIPNLAGIKYTAPTLYEYQSCLAYRQGNYNILFGMDEMLLPAMAVGAKGAIGSTYTFAAPLYYEMMDAFKSGDIGQAIAFQQDLINMVNIILKYPAISAQKAIMKMQGLDLGQCRLPLQNLSSGEVDSLKSALKDAGIYDRIIECASV